MLTGERLNVHLTGLDMLFPILDTRQSLFPQAAQHLGFSSTSV